MNLPIVYAAYNAAPADLERNPLEEDAWYRRLAEQPRISGLELRCTGELHSGGTERLVELLDPRWRNVVTDIPLVIAKTADDAAYGLASSDAQGRARAMSDVKRLHEEVGELLERRPESVIAVELHSAPPTRGGRSSVEVLAESLAEIAAWDWSGVELLIEHADAERPGQLAQKGWMGLTDELAAIDTSGASVGIAINWGRSVIETRDAGGVLEQIARTASLGLLRGLMFSGAATTDSEWGAAWRDVHFPASEIATGSLLTAERIREALATAGSGLLYTGVKVGRDPEARTIEARLAPGLATLALLP